MIDNYVARGDLTNIAHSGTERGLTGWQYEVSGSSLGATPTSRHDVDLLLDALAAQAGLSRYQIGQ
jgi:hypothetical protein